MKTINQRELTLLIRFLLVIYSKKNTVFSHTANFGWFTVFNTFQLVTQSVTTHSTRIVSRFF